jgi:hypothetical protein
MLPAVNSELCNSARVEAERIQARMQARERAAKAYLPIMYDIVWSIGDAISYMICAYMG